MTAWTDGKTQVVCGPAGLSVHRGGKAKLILSLEQLGGPLPPKKGKAGFARLRPLAVAPNTKVAFTIDVERKLVRTALDAGGESIKFPWDITELAPVDAKRVFAAYVTGTKARAMTSIVIGAPPADPKAKWEHDYEAERPSKVEWPEELLWEKAPWSRKTRWATNPDLIEINANAHGFTVYDLASAVVGVLRRPAGKLIPEGFSAVLRTPKEKGSTLAATATAKGVLIATCRAKGESVLAEYDDDGKLLGHRVLAAAKIGPLVTLGPKGERALALIDRRKLQLISLADLSPVAELELPAQLPASRVHLRAPEDGRSFLLAAGEQLLAGRVEADSLSGESFDLSSVPSPGKAHEAEIPMAKIVEPEEPTGADGKPLDLRPRIITQAPRLSLDPNQPNDAWNFKTGGEFQITLKAVSVGGPSETGLYVEVYGDALAQGLVEPHSVAIEGENEGKAEFREAPKKRLAVLPDFRLPAGVEPVKDKKVKPKERFLDNPEDTFLTIRLAGKVAQAGGEAGPLLFVRVGFEGAETEGSILRGRPVTIDG